MRVSFVMASWHDCRRLETRLSARDLRTEDKIG